MLRYWTDTHKSFCKIFALLLVVFTALPLFCSCQISDYEKALDGTIVYIEPSYIHYDEVDYFIDEANKTSEESFLSGYYGENIFYPKRYSDLGHHTHFELPEDAPKNGEEIQILSQPYIVNDIEAVKLLTHKETFYQDSFVYDGELVLIYFTKDGKIFKARYVERKPSEDIDIGVDAARAKALEYINGRLKDEIKIDIDLSKYELLVSGPTTSHLDDNYHFVWARVINGRLIDELSVTVMPDGAIYGFSSYPSSIENPENNTVILMTEKEIEKYVFPILEEKLSGLTDKGYDLVFEGEYKDSNSKYNSNVFYYESIDKYVLFVQVQFRIVNKDKNIDIPQSAGFLIPLYNE